MALKLLLYDRYGNSYSDGYRRWSELHINTKNKTIVAIFEDWKDESARNTAGIIPFRIIDYSIGPNRGPAKLAYDGAGVLDEQVLNSMGISVHHTINLNEGGNNSVTVLSHDGNPSIDVGVLSNMGVSILEPPIPSYDDFAGPDNVNPSGVGSMVYSFVKTRPENINSEDV